MSDFDKEAERERLREKYEQEEQDRETTERMSELLLKGATMTNAHCGDCGDPIFRYEGQEFCPTCQQVVTEADQSGAAHPAENGEGASDTDTPESEPTVQAEPEEPPAPEHSEAEPASPEQVEPESAQPQAEDSAPLPAETGERAPATTPDREQHPSPAPEREQQPAPTPDREQRPTRQREPEPAAGTGEQSGDLADARESLTRTLTRFSRQAEAAEDPRRARDNLEAAREAAETLAALSDVR